MKKQLCVMLAAALSLSTAWATSSSPCTGTLPILHINIYNTFSSCTDLFDDNNFPVDAFGYPSSTATLNNDVISYNLADKDYRPGYYWLEIPEGCTYASAEGMKAIGSQDKPLPLEMKARGNWTRTGFAKKPFKLKLGKKQNMLALSSSKSKHYAILAHADDSYGYMRNYVGFNLGQRMGMPWTPGMQPVEVIINGDYRGLYFLTESIRVGDGRVPIQELDDQSTTRANLSGGYLVELDNYDEDNQIQMDEAHCSRGHKYDKLRITFDTPEVYSDLQRLFITQQFTAMNQAVGRCNTSDDLWAYIDLDDAAKYYIVNEIISHWESYHGSTYLYRDRYSQEDGYGKWHFTPLWDCGNAFNGSTTDYFYNCDSFGNTWITSMVLNDKFMTQVKAWWKYFMNNCYDGILSDIDTYASRITTAATYDYNRWKGLTVSGGSYCADNRDMASRKTAVVNHLNSKISWLKQQWGDYAGVTTEPTADATPAAELPYWVIPGPDYGTYTIYFNDLQASPWPKVYCYVEESNVDGYPISGAAFCPLGAFPGSKMIEKGTVASTSPKAVNTDLAYTHYIEFTPDYPLSQTAKISFSTGSSSTQTASLPLEDGAVYNYDGNLSSGVENVAVDIDHDTPVEYYDLMGRRLTQPVPGQPVIIRRGSTVTKQLAP